MDAGEETDRRVDAVDAVEKRAQDMFAGGLVQRLSQQVLIDAVKDKLPAAAGVAPEAVGDRIPILGIGREGVGHGVHLGPHAVGDHAVIVEKQYLHVHVSRSALAV